MDALYILLVTFIVCRASIESSQTTTLTAKNILRRLFICIQGGAEILLLQFNVLKCFIDAILLTFSCLYVAEQGSDLRR